MSFRTAIYDLMNDVESDVYPIVAPQGLTVPYAVWSTRREPVRVQEGIDVMLIFMTVNIYANDFSDCDALATTIYNNLEHNNSSYGTEIILGCTFIGDSDDYIPSLDKYLITQEYQIHFD